MRHNARTSLESLRLRTHSAERATPPGAPLSIAIAAAGPARRNAGKGKRKRPRKYFSRRGALRRLRRVEQQNAPQLHDHGLRVFVQDQCELVADFFGLGPAP